VPEAFHLLLPGADGFRTVHGLTTASEQIDSGIGEWRVNLTGGNKLMTFVGLDWARQFGCGAFYIEKGFLLFRLSFQGRLPPALRSRAINRGILRLARRHGDGGELPLFLHRIASARQFVDKKSFSRQSGAFLSRSSH